MKIKIIDLLNKMANGEQPSHIRVFGRDWYWNNYDGYVTKSSLSTTHDAQNYLFKSYRLDFALDEKVEIIEEPVELPNEYKIPKMESADNERILQAEIKINKIISYLKAKEELLNKLANEKTPPKIKFKNTTKPIFEYNIRNGKYEYCYKSNKGKNEICELTFLNLKDEIEIIEEEKKIELPENIEIHKIEHK